MFRAAVTSRSWTTPQLMHVHSLTSRPFVPLGPPTARHQVPPTMHNAPDARQAGGHRGAALQGLRRRARRVNIVPHAARPHASSSAPQDLVCACASMVALAPANANTCQEAITAQARSTAQLSDASREKRAKGQGHHSAVCGEPCRSGPMARFSATSASDQPVATPSRAQSARAPGRRGSAVPGPRHLRQVASRTWRRACSGPDRAPAGPTPQCGSAVVP